MSRFPTGYEDDELDERPDPLSGSVHVNEARDLDERLLDLIAEASRLFILLEEADEAEFKRVSRRLAVLKSSVASLPDAPAHFRSPMGFRSPKKMTRSRK